MNWLRISWDRHLNQKRNKWHSPQIIWIILLNYVNSKLCKRWITLLTHHELILTFLFSFSNNYIPYHDMPFKHTFCCIYNIWYVTNRLHWCWRRILETKWVSDNLNMLVTALAILVINIEILSPTIRVLTNLTVINITVSQTSHQDFTCYRIACLRTEISRTLWIQRWK